MYWSRAWYLLKPRGNSCDWRSQWVKVEGEKESSLGSIAALPMCCCRVQNLFLWATGTPQRHWNGLIGELKRLERALLLPLKSPSRYEEF